MLGFLGPPPRSLGRRTRADLQPMALSGGMWQKGR
jgi:hypothetical protein